MLSEEANNRFKTLIKTIRIQITKGIFDNVNTDVMYLPMDLNMMLSHLFQIALHQHLNTKLIAGIRQEQATSLTTLLKQQAQKEDEELLLEKDKKGSPRKRDVSSSVENHFSEPRKSALLYKR